MPRFLNKRKTAELTGYSQRSIMEKGLAPDDDFPAPIRLSIRKVVFDSDEIEAWQERRIAENRAGS